MRTPTFLGSPDERSYHVVVLVDGRPIYHEHVDARSSEQACIAAFCAALHKILSEASTPGPPVAPPVAAPPGAEQLRLPVGEDDKSVADA